MDVKVSAMSRSSAYLDSGMGAGVCVITEHHQFQDATICRNLYTTGNLFIVY